ncbi:Oxalate:formate antiporter [Fasciola gigantica]|uniref:Oxalate:formate antiporter n=1 Tax=Fasciola gigantica TaxID=46835 RepID=A0A504Z0M1_FASGI|nr:Oxalate:formate antiporter [Fasciola gigantica]
MGFIALVFTYGVLQGFGFGLAYAVIIAVAAMWFPKRRGLIVGLIVGGFGAGSLIFTPIQTTYINPTNVEVNPETRTFTDPELLARIPTAFLVLSAITAGIQVIGILIMRRKENKDKAKDAKGDVEALEQLHHGEGDQKAESYIHALDNEKADAIRNGDRDNKKNKVSGRADYNNEINVPPKVALKTADFYLLWLAVCFSVIPITILSSLFKMVGQSFISDDLFLAAVAMASSLCNAGGRVIWGCICDRLSFKLPFCSMLVVWCALLFGFPHITSLTGLASKVVYCIWVCTLFLCLSGVFVLAPTATEVLYGPTHLAVNYGLVYNSFIFGSLLAAVLTKAMDKADGFYYQFGLCGSMCIIALLFILWIDDRKLPSCVRFLNYFSNLRRKYDNRCCRKTSFRTSEIAVHT